MTTAADDRAAEEAFEASLAGRAVPGEAAGLAAFTRAVRGTATQPGRPNAALADLLSTGLLTDQSSPSARTAPAAGSLPSRSTRSRTRRRFTVIVPALFAKFLSAGAVAQAATGAGVVCVVVTGAGAVGALPGDAQTTFDDVTGISQTAEPAAEDVTAAEETTTPTEAGQADPTQLPSTDTSVPAAPTTPTDPIEEPTAEEAAAAAEAAARTTWLEGPADGQNFGQWVSEGRAHGWATGRIVSDMAHKRNDDRKNPDQADDSDEQESDDSGNDSPSDLDDDSDDSSDGDSSDEDEDRSGSGKGGGNSGKGSSNSGKGNRN